MEIRKDMLSIAQYLERLLVYAKVFETNNVRHWSHLKNKEDFANIYLLNSKDRRVLERIYEAGRDLAVHMSYKLCAFNYAEEYPSLISYVESFKEGWLDEVEDLQDILDRAREKCKELGSCPWAVEQMMILFEDQLKILASVSQTLSILRQSDLFRIESGESPMTRDKIVYSISHVSGRVNVNSDDHSVNQDISVKGDIFELIRGSISNSNMQEKDKETILGKLSDLQGAVGSTSFVEKYQKFLQSAANHMTVLAPFIPALSKLLG